MRDTHYPFTYADDFIRAIPEPSSKGVVLSRSDASQILLAISTILEIPHEVLASKIADVELAKSPEDTERQVERILAALKGK